MPVRVGLATPLSVTVSTGRAAQMGVLIRSAEALETCGKINAVVLDKTGTITAGKPSLTDVFPLGKWRKMPDDLLAITASAERDSEHPLAAAIVAGAQERHLTLGETTQFRAISGRGVTAHVALPLISANNPTVAADESSASSVTFESSISSPETAMYNVAVGNTDLIDDLDVAMPSVGNEDLDDIIATMERLSAEGKNADARSNRRRACGNRGRCGYGESRFAAGHRSFEIAWRQRGDAHWRQRKRRRVPWPIKLALAM